MAVQREKFPEKIPFRLTRMLVKAMEVSGIEGNFRSSCEAVMKMLRHNHDSVLAMLEAFVHDPLINWRLLVRPEADESHSIHDSVSALPPAPSHEDKGMRLAGDGVASAAAGAEGKSRQPASLLGTPMLHAHALVLPCSCISASLTASSRRGRTEPVQQHDEQALNERALSVLRRVKAKLAGADFIDEPSSLDVPTQVNRLLLEAQSNLNLCQLYVGWCAFW